VEKTTDEDTSISIPLTLSDAESSASSLTMSGFATDTGLLPPTSFAFSGSGANRSVTITPAANQNGTTSVTLSVSDGEFKTTRTFSFTVVPVNDPPTLSAITGQTMMQDTSKSISFTIGDVDNAVDSLTLTAISSNTLLLPNSSIILTGTGANRGLTLTPAAFQEGTVTITLSASDGSRVTTTNFLLTVTAPNTIVAATAGQLNNPLTWGLAIPVAGDTSSWRSGANNLSMTNATETFNGMSLVIQTGGQLVPGLPSANLTLNQLVLNGGLITVTNNLGLNIDLSGKYCTLLNGTLKSGGLNNGRDLRFKNGFLAGSGTIAITGVDATGSDVEFQSTVNTKGFTGIFDVKQNGILNLSPISDANASFGVILSGTGKMTHDANVTLTSLVIDGVKLPDGIYRYADFTATQQAYLVNTTGVITLLTPSPVLTTLESWRFSNFGTTAETAASSSTADPNGDGESNLMEYATSQSPMANTSAQILIQNGPSSLDFIYTRRLSALTSGMTYSVEWSDTLAANSWSTTGISETILSTVGDLQTVKATVSNSADEKRFVRLRVIQL
jgi:hypothetical protein